MIPFKRELSLAFLSIIHSFFSLLTLSIGELIFRSSRWKIGSAWSKAPPEYFALNLFELYSFTWIMGLKDSRSSRLKDSFSGVRELAYPWNSVHEFIFTWRDRITAVWQRVHFGRHRSYSDALLSNKAWDHKYRVNYGLGGTWHLFQYTSPYRGDSQRNRKNTTTIPCACIPSFLSFLWYRRSHLFASLCVSVNFSIAFYVIFIHAEHVMYFIRCWITFKILGIF